jgi:hypothetical protein
MLLQRTKGRHNATVPPKDVWSNSDIWSQSCPNLITQGKSIASGQQPQGHSGRLSRLFLCAIPCPDCVAPRGLPPHRGTSPQFAPGKKQPLECQLWNSQSHPPRLACSAVMSVLAFMIGRCGRKLPIDGMLPRVVHSARFSHEKDRPRPAPEPARPSWPHAG